MRPFIGFNIQVATLIAAYANWGFAKIKGVGWGWAGVIWLYSIVTFLPLDVLKFAIRYILSGKAWNNLIDNKVILIDVYTLFHIFYVLLVIFINDVSPVYLKQTAFTTKKDYGREEREAQWATAQRTLHGLQTNESQTLFADTRNYRELSEIAEQAKRRAEVAR